MSLNVILYTWKIVSTANSTEIHKDIDLEVQLVDIQNEGDSINTGQLNHVPTTHMLANTLVT